MDLYIVDGNWNKTNIIDGFNALIWTERYNDSGDVTLTLPATAENKALITEGIFLHMPLSQEIMLIETVSNENGVLTAKGNSLFEFLKNRLFRYTWDDYIQGYNPIGVTAGNVFNYIATNLLLAGGFYTSGQILTSAQGTNEVIPKLTVGAEVSGSTLSLSVPNGTVYDALKNIADSDNLGFTLYPPNVADGTGNLVIKAYRGLDRTTSQSTNGQVIFDPAMDTLANVSELRSIAGYKNVAWVWPTNITAQSQIAVAYAPGVSSSVTSWQRRTLMVEASDVDPVNFATTADMKTVLTARGRDALANNNYVKTVDGQIVPQGLYVYGTDYNLGDIIELRGATGGASQKARVNEYIRAQDNTGETAYPTLQVV